MTAPKSIKSTDLAAIPAYAAGSDPRIKVALSMLRDGGLVFDNGAIDAKLEKYHRLLKVWNPRLRLLSAAGLADFVGHVIDSWSLAPYIVGGSDSPVLLDIGTGGGFPALPLGLIVPTLDLTLIERSERKAVFIRTALKDLDINADLYTGNFPDVGPARVPNVITCRAIENPEALASSLHPLITEGAVVLAQSDRLKQALEHAFPAKEVKDAWSDTGFRRGQLYLIG